MFLSAADLHALTGRKRKDGQRAWLTEHGYKFELTADGRPVVLKAAVEDRLGGTTRGRREPDWGILSGKKAA